MTNDLPIVTLFSEEKKPAILRDIPAIKQISGSLLLSFLGDPIRALKLNSLRRTKGVKIEQSINATSFTFPIKKTAQYVPAKILSSPVKP